MVSHDLQVKFACSCIRSIALDELIDGIDRVATKITPREGDLVCVEVAGNEGAYTRCEDQLGREVPLHPGDRFLGVMGSRRSSTNVYAVLPNRAIRSGDVLDLVAVGGLIGEATCVPAYLGGSTLKVRVVGFPASQGGDVLNLTHFLGPSNADESNAKLDRPLYVVCGTSAECGKTTLGCALVQSLARTSRVGAIKATGTGRLRDLARYTDAGARWSKDFVHLGWPSTYGIEPEEYMALLKELLTSPEGTDALTVELGGDLFEGNSGTALRYLGAEDPAVRVFLVANDSMGAQLGLSLLSEHGLQDVLVGTMKQNVQSMSERLGGRAVLDVNRPADAAAAL